MTEFRHARTPDAGRADRFAKDTARTHYDVSPTSSADGVLRDAHTKGDNGTRGSCSPRTRRTLPHCGQRAGSAGAITLEPLPDNATLGSNNRRARCKRAARCRLLNKP